MNVLTNGREFHADDPFVSLNGKLTQTATLKADGAGIVKSKSWGFA